MRGVLADENLHTLAVAAIFTAELVPVVEDGGAFPVVAAFIWPDGSVGVLDRLTADVNGVPLSIKMTHVASGRNIDLDLSTNSLLRLLIGGIITIVSGTASATFADVDAMLSSDSSIWEEAYCKNYVGTDNNKSIWRKVVDDTLVPMTLTFYRRLMARPS